jgi:hypothetical protein
MNIDKFEPKSEKPKNNKLNKFLKIGGLAALLATSSLTPKESTAQNSLPKDTTEISNKSIKTNEKKDTIQLEEIRKKEEAWLKAYYNSPKFLERLKKEKDIILETPVVELPISKELNAFLYSKGTQEKENLLKNISSNEIYFKKEGADNMDSTITGTFDPHTLKIDINQTKYNQPEYTKHNASVIHELTHKSLRNTEFDPNPQSKLKDTVWNSAKNENVKGYWTKIEEVKPFLNSFRYILEQSGIYDAKTEDFTKEHLEKYKNLLKNYKGPSEYERLKAGYNDDTIIWLMNNIAGIDAPQNQNEGRA